MVGKRISLERNIPTANKQELSETLERTALCSFFAMGKCLRGKDCKFAHEVAQIRPKPDLTRTSLCHDFMRKGSCKSGNKCKYAHGEAQLRGPGKEQTLPPKPRTVGSPLLWDPLGLDEGSKELNELKELKEPIAPVSTLIPVLQRLMGKRTPQKTPPKTMSTPLAPVEALGPVGVKYPINQKPHAWQHRFAASACPATNNSPKQCTQSNTCLDTPVLVSLKHLPCHSNSYVLGLSLCNARNRSRLRSANLVRLRWETTSLPRHSRKPCPATRSRLSCEQMARSLVLRPLMSTQEFPRTWHFPFMSRTRSWTLTRRFRLATSFGSARSQQILDGHDS